MCSGFEVGHANKVMLLLARYHALGIAIKQKNPSFFRKVMNQARVASQNISLIFKGFYGILNNVKEVTSYSKHLTVMESSFANFTSGKAYTDLPEEPWATVTHGDLWVNNILFHKDEQGEIDDVKFVDFQIYMYNSPLRDVVFFICTSLNNDVLIHNHDELLNVYYESFVDTLERMNCNMEPFSRSAFDKELKKQAINEFPFAALVCKFSLFDVRDQENDEGKLVTNIYDCKASQVYKKKLLSILNVYEKKKWL